METMKKVAFWAKICQKKLLLPLEQRNDLFLLLSFRNLYDWTPAEKKISITSKKGLFLLFIPAFKYSSKQLITQII